ncbi:MAG: hypothetical protein KF784_18550 [Fimbriimonadaceae bacterium]|nr:hypothetical protein [Fimbriimonadaceae bacterium]MBX3649469.1 hypothetical protein [Rhodocyclaceae bacterium]
MYQLVQHRDRSALPPPLLVIVIVTTLLTSPGLAWPSESPSHSSQYDQLKASIAANSGDITCIARTLGALTEIHRSTPPTTPQSYGQLEKTIQDLTKEISTLNTRIARDSKPAKDREAISGNFCAEVVDTDLITAISNLTTKIDSIGGQKSTRGSWLEIVWEIVKGTVFPLLVIIVTLFATERPKQRKQSAKEQLEKFYAPVLGRLRANQDIWKNFTADTIETSTALSPEEILTIILYDPEAKRDQWLKKWVRAMEGIFRQNNEAAEETILENYGYLKPEDVLPGSDFDQERKNYLMHVGEFRAVLSRWDEAGKHYGEDTWYNRCRISLGIDINASTAGMPTLEQFLEYFHPTNPYPKEFLGEVQKSYDELMKDAGLGKRWWGRRL